MIETSKKKQADVFEEGAGDGRREVHILSLHQASPLPQVEQAIQQHPGSQEEVNQASQEEVNPVSQEKEEVN